MRNLILAALLAAGPSALWAGEVTIFAAASMKGSLDEIAAEFEARTGHDVVISYAGSNALAKQIVQGAPADIFLSAAVNWMDVVEAEGLVIERRDLLGNSLVLVGKGEPIALADLPQALGEEKLAMAMVDSVPAGQYGKAALMYLGLWHAVEPHVAQSDNVRATLALVASGEAPYGITYATDAKAEPDVTVAATFPAESHPAILYPLALLKDSDEAGRAFYEELAGEKASEIFTAAGFTVLH